jgi:hypothetical protein
MADRSRVPRPSVVIPAQRAGRLAVPAERPGLFPVQRSRDGETDG